MTAAPLEDSSSGCACTASRVLGTAWTLLPLEDSHEGTEPGRATGARHTARPWPTAGRAEPRPRPSVRGVQTVDWCPARAPRPALLRILGRFRKSRGRWSIDRDYPT